MFIDTRPKELVTAPAEPNVADLRLIRAWCKHIALRWSAVRVQHGWL